VKCGRGGCVAAAVVMAVESFMDLQLVLVVGNSNCPVCADLTGGDISVTVAEDVALFYLVISLSRYIKGENLPLRC